MTDLNKMIEEKREALNKLVNAKGVMDKSTIRVSQQLDNLIVQKMSESLSA